VGNEYVMPRGHFDAYYARNQPAFAHITVTPIKFGNVALTAVFFGYMIYPYYNYTGPGIDR
jgi:hypothetical protein